MEHAVDQRAVLSRRKGRCLTKRTILKSYQVPIASHTTTTTTAGITTTTTTRDLPVTRMARDYPVFSVGNVSVDALAALLRHLGAGPLGGEDDADVNAGGEVAAAVAVPDSGQIVLHDEDGIAISGDLGCLEVRPERPEDVHVVVCDLREEMVVSTAYGRIAV